MKRVIMLVCMSVVITTLFASDFFGVHVVRVYDGDTFFVDIAGLPEVFGKEIGIRVRGIDTPEIRGKCDEEKRLAYKARDFVIAVLGNASTVDLVDVDRDKYFRVLATVVVDGQVLGDILVQEGLAVVYDGGKKIAWCG